ncbi:hypothetical protein [Granulicoccus sp. GXG6511]|uniref:hypothetical protein n=1 Tax=Granulicoccus sp. GXG6511 TaxID=3381351 RepID=UPI003D7E5C05
MGALLLFIGLLLLARIITALRDTGTRVGVPLRLIFRVGAILDFTTVQDLERALGQVTARGDIVMDARRNAVFARRMFRRLDVFRGLALATAAALILFTGIPDAVVAVVAAVLLCVHGSRLVSILSLGRSAGPGGATDRFSTWVGYLTKAGLLVAGLMMVGVAGERFEDGAGWVAALLVVLATCAVGGSHVPARWLSRARQKHVAASGFGRDADRDSVLLLRSFGDDGIMIRTPLAGLGPTNPAIPFVVRERFEEFLGNTLMTRTDRLVAIGRPGERLPELGAVRTYYPDDQWQEAVQVTATRCAMIMIIAGSTDGLAWELEQLRNWELLNKTLVLLPPESNTQRAYTRFERVYQQLSEGQEPPTEEWNRAMWVGLSVRRGRVRHLVGEGQDWASYLTAISLFLSERDGDLAAKGDPDAVRNTVAQPGSEPTARDRRRILALLASGQGQPPSLAIETYRKVSERAEQAGAVALAAYAKYAYATALTAAGGHGSAWNACLEIIAACRSGFARYPIGSGQVISDLDLHVQARELMLALAAEHGVADVSQALRDLYAALVTARSWKRAAEVAAEIGSAEGAIDGINHWFRLAVTAEHRAGNQVGAARTEVEWARLLISRDWSHEAEPLIARAIEVLDRAHLDEDVKRARALLTRVPSQAVSNEDVEHQALRRRCQQIVEDDFTEAAADDVAWDIPALVPDGSLGDDSRKAIGDPTAIEWDFGECESPAVPDYGERPPGLADEPLSPRSARILEWLLVLGNSSRFLPLRMSVWRVGVFLARRAGASGAEGLFRVFMGEQLSVRHPKRAERILKNVLAAREAGWIRLGDITLTGAELVDVALGSLVGVKILQCDLAAVAEIERRRLEKVHLLRASDAPELAAKRLARALAYVGGFEEADNLFAQAAERRPDDHQLHFMWAANSVARGDGPAAQRQLLRAMALRGGATPTPATLGLEGDVARLLGDDEGALQAYRAGVLNEYATSYDQRRFDQRFTALGAVRSRDYYG